MPLFFFFGRFSGDEAVKRGQFVYFVTERAVFRRTSSHDVLELIEIAPGVDLQKDILDQMDFVPAISPDLTLMDDRIFKDEKMNAASDFFGSLEGKTIGWKGTRYQILSALADTGNQSLSLSPTPQIDAVITKTTTPCIWTCSVSP